MRRGHALGAGGALSAQAARGVVGMALAGGGKGWQAVAARAPTGQASAAAGLLSAMAAAPGRRPRGVRQAPARNAAARGPDEPFDPAGAGALTPRRHAAVSSSGAPVDLLSALHRIEHDFMAALRAVKPDAQVAQAAH